MGLGPPERSVAAAEPPLLAGDAKVHGVPQFSTHTLRHLCLTDLARMGWEIHAIAAFAGHRHTDSTLTYVHLSGRDLAGKLASGMDHVHAWRVRMLTSPGEASR